MKQSSNDKPTVPFSPLRSILPVNDDDDGFSCFVSEWLLRGC